MSEPAIESSGAAEGPTPRRLGDHGRRMLALAARWGVVVAFVVTALVFYALKPDAFGEAATWRGILNQAAVPMIVAMGLTVALVVGDFDLSIGSMMGLAMAVVVTLMVYDHVGWVLASILALCVGAAVGLLNGALVAGFKVNAFIATLAVSSVVMGVEAKVSNQETIPNGIPIAFQEIGTGKSLFQLNTLFWIAIVVGILLYLLMGQTETGRYMYAIGGNSEAARLSGVKVRSLRVLGFVASGVCAALGGILLAASSASYYPNPGTGFLLPAYAAAFLGTAVTGGRFAIAATAFGVLFLQLLQTGLTVLNVETWIVNVIQGSVLAIAVILGSAGSSLRIIGRRREVAVAGGAVASDNPDPKKES